MTTPEVLCQISTFLVAGYETTSSALTWCLYALARNRSAQHHLRAALWTIPPESPTLDEDVAKLEYLDWVVRETLRVHAPVTWTMRVAMESDNIPVERPFLDRWGRVRHGVRVSKGDIITVPIQAINKSRQIWGEDAQLFKCVGLGYGVYICLPIDRNVVVPGQRDGRIPLSISGTCVGSGRTC